MKAITQEEAREYDILTRAEFTLSDEYRSVECAYGELDRVEAVLKIREVKDFAAVALDAIRDARDLVREKISTLLDGRHHEDFEEFIHQNGVASEG